MQIPSIQLMVHTLTLPVQRDSCTLLTGQIHCPNITSTPKIRADATLLQNTAQPLLSLLPVTELRQGLGQG